MRNILPATPARVPGRGAGDRRRVVRRARAVGQAQPPAKAQIAISLDLEMSRNFPAWDDTHWDYEKGNLNDPTKDYTVEACRRVKAAGGVLHYLRGRPRVRAARRRVAQGDRRRGASDRQSHLRPRERHGHQDRGHPVPLPARALAHRGRTAGGSDPREHSPDERRTKERIGVDAAGFRTPGGFAAGLADRPDVQQTLLGLGFSWVSSVYRPHPLGEPKNNRPKTSTTRSSPRSHRPSRFATKAGWWKFP